MRTPELDNNPLHEPPAAALPPPRRHPTRQHPTHRRTAARSALALALAVAATAPAALAAAQAPVLLGVVTALSGAEAEPFGVPALRAAELMAEAINAGRLPAPYARRGLGGAPIKLTLVDEAGPATLQADAYRQLVGSGGVDAVIGYTSSANCMAVAPLADELEQLTVFSDCGTPQVFEDADREYLFRTGATSTMDSTAAALYVAEMRPDLRRVAGINAQDFSGTTAWNAFEAALRNLRPALRVVGAALARPQAADYEREIAIARGAEIVHSSLWGSDAEALILQGAPRELFRRSTLVMPSASPAIWRLGAHVPEGTIVGARGPFEAFAPDTALQRWFKAAYEQRHYVPPSYPAYKMAQAILGLKSAWEAAQAINAGARPSKEQVVTAFEHLSFEGPAGRVSMALGKGHQAVQETAYGTARHVNGRVTLVDVRRYPAALTTPPDGTKARDWIRTHFGASTPCAD